MLDRDRARRLLLRSLVALAATLAAIGFAFGCFPGVAVYRGDELVAVRPVIEHRNWLLGILVLVLAPGAVIWRHPRIAYALLWTLWTIAIATLVLFATVELPEPGVRTVALWPHAVFGVVMFALLFVAIVVVPIACAVLWWVTRDRPASLPVARAHFASGGSSRRGL